jgi:CXXX repeat modification system protein
MKKTSSRKTVKKPANDLPRVVGRVTPKERDEIQALYERKNGLNELALSLQQSGALAANDALYEKIVSDIGRTATLSKEWWTKKSKAYGWENVAGCHWTVDFGTCDISLNR